MGSKVKTHRVAVLREILKDECTYTKLLDDGALEF